MAVGNYQSSFDMHSFEGEFRAKVYDYLSMLLIRLRQACDDNDDPEALIAANIHMVAVMGPFYRHVSHPDLFVSHSTCYACLMAPPEHPLPCGHVFCTPCLRAFGNARGKSLIEMEACPMHIQDTIWNPPWPVTLKPASAGIRILTLDGYVSPLLVVELVQRDVEDYLSRGGVRGIVELEILRQLEQNLGGNIPIRAFFDLIVGTR